MNAQQVAEALAAHPRWEWREGIGAVVKPGLRWAGEKVRIQNVYGASRATRGCTVTIWPVPIPHESWERGEVSPRMLLVNFADPATAGVLLGMLPERQLRVEHWAPDPALGQPARWVVRCHACSGIGDTLGGACARALLELWGAP